MSNPSHIQHVEILCGIPASGKSTYAHLRVSRDGYVRVNKDGLRQTMLCTQFDAQKEGFIHALQKHTIEYLLDQGHNIVIDNTHVTRNSRREIHELVAVWRANKELLTGIAHPVHVTTAYFGVDVDECTRRNAWRTSPVPDEVISYMYARLEPPTPEEKAGACPEREN